eukprot:UN24824
MYKTWCHTFLLTSWQYLTSILIKSYYNNLTIENYMYTMCDLCYNRIIYMLHLVCLQFLECKFSYVLRNHFRIARNNFAKNNIASKSRRLTDKLPSL